MKWRSIIAYYVLAACLGGYLYLVHGNADSAAGNDAENATGVGPIVETLASRIDRLSIRAGGVRVIAERDGESWNVTDPAGTVLPNGLIDALLDTITTIPAVEILDVEKRSLEKFGLDPPQTVLRFSTGNESANESAWSLEFGVRNPTRTAVYVRAQGARQVHLLGLNAKYYVELLLDEVTRSSDRRATMPHAASAPSAMTQTAEPGNVMIEAE